MEKKYTIKDLYEIAASYCEDIENHTGCSYGQPDGPDDYCKECDCELYEKLDCFILFVKYIKEDQKEFISDDLYDVLSDVQGNRLAHIDGCGFVARAEKGYCTTNDDCDWEYCNCGIYDVVDKFLSTLD